MTTASGEPSTPGSVRPARPADAAAVAELQVRTWREVYADLLPGSVLAELDAETAEQAWTAAIDMPPTPHHHVLVAVDSATDTVVGFTAVSPAGDEDADPSTDAELAILVVDPAFGRQGHGSRLLAAAVDVMRADGCTRAVAWLLAQDDALRGLLVSAGWGTDGSHRSLDAADGSAPLRQLRLHTDLTEAEA